MKKVELHPFALSLLNENMGLPRTEAELSELRMVKQMLFGIRSQTYFIGGNDPFFDYVNQASKRLEEIIKLGEQKIRETPKAQQIPVPTRWELYDNPGVGNANRAFTAAAGKIIADCEKLLAKVKYEDEASKSQLESVFNTHMFRYEGLAKKYREFGAGDTEPHGHFARFGIKVMKNYFPSKDWEIDNLY